MLRGDVDNNSFKIAQYMKLLHTSDWHLGRTLAGKHRYDEFSEFLRWLLIIVEREAVEAILVAGDVFDKTAPSHRAQELYYDFLSKVSQTCCQSVVIIGGNHDSPTFLRASRELLKGLKVYVVASISECLEDEIIVLQDESGSPQLIVCAVPYLRDREVRTVEAGESIEDKGAKLIEGIRNHYHVIADQAEEKRRQLAQDIPIMAMGHLFTQGGRTIDGDGVRQLYVGSLAHVNDDIFPDVFQYVALGHLHVPQKVGKSERIIYCGSPIPMGFGEAEQKKSVHLVEITARSLATQPLEIPVFQKLKRIKGDWQEISDQIDELIKEQSDAWLEINHEDDEIIGDLRERLNRKVEGTNMEIIIMKNKPAIKSATELHDDCQTLDDLTPYDIFEELLSAQKVPKYQRNELRRTYGELLNSMHEEDPQHDQKR